MPPSVHTPNAAISPTETLLPIDLPYALRLVNAANPTIALAQERVAEAYAVLKQTQVMWVPNLWLGGNPYAPTVLSSFYHHDGLIQNANGQVFFTDKNSFFLGSGVGMILPVADAVYGPKIARAGTEAVEARARVVRNDVQLDVALAYLELLRAYGALAINYEALQKAEEMLRTAESAFKRGLAKTGADPDRAERKSPCCGKGGMSCRRTPPAPRRPWRNCSCSTPAPICCRPTRPWCQSPCRPPTAPLMN